MSVSFVILFLLGSSVADAANRHVALGPFGGASGPQFSGPTSLAVDPATHDLLVVEQGSGSVSRWHGDGTPSDFSALGGNRIEGLGFSASFETQIAVAPPGAPAGTAGDIYVTQTGAHAVAVFTASGESLGQLTESSNGAFGEICGLSVDASGALYVGDYGEGVHKFVPTSNPPGVVDNVANFAYAEICNAAAGAGPTSGALFATTYGGLVRKLDASSGSELAEIANFEKFIVLAVDPDSGALFVGAGGEGVLEYDATGSFATLESTISTAGSPEGIAVDPGSGRIFVSEEGSDRVAVFSAFPNDLPEAVTTAPTGRTATAATLNGEVDPEGLPLTECFFEYGATTAYGQTAPCSAPDAAEVGGREEFVAVHAEAAGLSAAVEYHYRLVAVSAEGSVPGSDVAFRTAGPAVAGMAVSRVGSTSARLEGEVNPEGEPTTYYFQYLSEAAYAANGDSFEGPQPAIAVPVGGASIGAGSSPVAVDEQIGGLSPATTYRARLVATQASATVAGASVGFTTYAAAASGLPDGRAYEQVSPVDKNGGNAQGNVDLIQAASGGDAVTFYSQTGIPGGEGAQEFPQFLASRSATAWSTQGLLPPQGAGPFAGVLGWPEDLSRDYVFARRVGEPSVIYERSTTDRSLRPILESTGETHFAGASPDGATAVFEAESASLPGAAGEGAQNLYIWGANSAQLRLAGVMNDGDAPAEGAFAGSYAWLRGATSIGGPSARQYSASLHGLSADGSRLFFTAAGSGQLFVRLNPLAEQSKMSGERCLEPATSACTVHVSAPEAGMSDPNGEQPAAFMAATPSGSHVFFTSPQKLTQSATTGPADEGGDLYDYNVSSGELIDLTVDAGDPAGAEVQGVLGTSDDGSYVYFAANGVLAGGGSPGSCRRGESSLNLGRCNLYLWHDGVIAFIAPLDLETGGAVSDLWNWSPESGPQGTERASRVSADGKTLVFRSQARLTSYDNHSQPEFYRYTVGGPVRCLTCDPIGTAPVGPATLRSVQTLGKPTGAAPLLTRNLSSDGDRFFFESPDKLVPGDVNGDEGCPFLPTSAGETPVRSCQDVYEWEAPDASDATDTCTATSAAYVPSTGGCLFLISTGTSPEPSYFADASPNGDDAFLFTSQPLVGQDRDELQDVYDARVGGGLGSQNPASPTPCGGEGSCRAQAQQPAPGASPGSAAYSGLGNARPPKKHHHKKHRRHHRHHHRKTHNHKNGKRPGHGQRARGGKEGGSR